MYGAGADVLISSRTVLRFLNRHELYDRLSAAGLLELQRALADLGDRIYKQSGRVKSPHSFVMKAEQREMKRPLAEMTDIVGLRVVCLFRSDLGVASEAIRSWFIIVREEDKAATRHDDSVFEYEDIQFVVRLPQHAGSDPELARFRFEIQLRTLAMDTWATISHLVAYKEEPHLPRDLGHEFYATNAMLWLADRTFDNVDRYRASTGETLSLRPSDDDHLNHSTLAAYLMQRFPDRCSASGRIDHDEMLLTECVLAGARTVGDLRQLLDVGLVRIEDRISDLDGRTFSGQSEHGHLMPARWVASEALRAVSPVCRTHARMYARQSHAEGRSEALARMPFAPSTYEEFVWRLSKRLKKEPCDAVSLRISREILKELNVDVPSAVQWFESLGGYCDCEVLMNVDYSVSDYEDS